MAAPGLATPSPVKRRPNRTGESRASPPFDKLGSPALTQDPADRDKLESPALTKDPANRDHPNLRRTIRVAVLRCELPSLPNTLAGEEAPGADSHLLVGIDGENHTVAMTPSSAVTEPEPERGPELGVAPPPPRYFVADGSSTHPLFAAARGKLLHLQWWRGDQMVALGHTELLSDGHIDGASNDGTDWVTLRDEFGEPTAGRVHIAVESWDPSDTPPPSPAPSQIPGKALKELTPQEQLKRDKKKANKRRQQTKEKASREQRARMVLEDEGLAQIEAAERGIFGSPDVAGLVLVMSTPPHADNPTVVAAALSSLQLLYDVSLSSRMHLDLRLKESRAIESVLSILVRHRDSPGVMAAGFSFLEILLHEDGASRARTETDPGGEWGGTEESCEAARAAIFRLPPLRSALPNLGQRAAAGQKRVQESSGRDTGEVEPGVEIVSMARECIASITARSQLAWNGENYERPTGGFSVKATKGFLGQAVRAFPAAPARPIPAENNREHLAARTAARDFLETAGLSKGDERPGSLGYDHYLRLEIVKEREMAQKGKKGKKHQKKLK
jgi:hypothetical protein